MPLPGPAPLPRCPGGWGDSENPWSWSRSRSAGRRGRAGRCPSARGSGRCGGAQRPALPLPELGGAFPSNNPGWEGLFVGPRASRRRPLPHRVYFRPRWAGEDRCPVLGPRLRKRAPVARTPGSSSPAPAAPPPRAPARAAVRYADGAGAGYGSAAAARRARRGAGSRMGARCAVGGQPGVDP